MKKRCRYIVIILTTIILYFFFSITIMRKDPFYSYKVFKIGINPDTVNILNDNIKNLENKLDSINFEKN